MHLEQQNVSAKTRPQNLPPVAHAGHLRATLLLTVVVLALAGCGGGAGTETTPPTGSGGGGGGPSDIYSGAPAQTTDVQAFKLSFYDNLRGLNRCGQCHSSDAATPQAPFFVERGDVNAAYNATTSSGIIDTNSPPASSAVTRVGAGHSCWLASDAVCANIITSYIEAWRSGTASGGGRAITLVAPPDVSPSATLSWPQTAPAEYSAVHNILRQRCNGCHQAASASPQPPYFANSDIDISYEAVKQSRNIDLATPANSRIHVRVRDGFHNCWEVTTGQGADCPANGTLLLAAINTFIGALPPADNTFLNTLVASRALYLDTNYAIAASGGNRFEANMIALYEFKAGAGNTIYDTSGVGSSRLDLTLAGTEDTDYRWLATWGVEFMTGTAKAQATTSASRKLYDMIRLSNEYTIEAWATPARTDQNSANIIGYSGGTQARNFTLSQDGGDHYVFRNRSTVTDANGEPELKVAQDGLLLATQQHVVLTFDPINGRRIFINGVQTDDIDQQGGGSLADWDNSLAFVMGNEVSQDRPWEGTLRLVAMHSRALTPGQVRQNFDAGVGQKFYLLFNIDAYVGTPDSYVMFEVSQYDDYSYYFNRPTFISLDPNADPDGIRIQGLWLGINGKLALAGQSFRNMDVTLSSGQYSAQTGQVLSTLATTIALENGPGATGDQFFLAFENIAGNTSTIPDTAPNGPDVVADTTPMPDIGIHTFEEIKLAMAQMTGIDPNLASISGTIANDGADGIYTAYKQQLPSVASIEGFLSAHQMGISQLSIVFCDELARADAALTPSDPNRYFANFNFNTIASQAFDTATEVNLIIDPLLEKIAQVDLANSSNSLTTQPVEADARTELENLITNMLGCGAACSNDSARTRQIVTGACAAMLGSAAMLIQ